MVSRCLSLLQGLCTSGRGPRPAPTARCGARCRWSFTTRSRACRRGSRSRRSSKKVHRLATSGAKRRRLIETALVEVGLDPEAAERYPHEFSGGQRQRIAIARAMVLKPRFVVLDEPTSALDMSVQAQIVDLLQQLQRDHRLGYLFISHDLRVVRALAHRIVVLRHGRVVEQGSAEDVLARPRHAYTRALMAAAFMLDADDSVVAEP